MSLVDLGPEIKLPHNGWEARRYQRKLWNYFKHGGKRAIAIWHRRAGKDDVGLHLAAIEMHKRVCNVVHCLPEFEQGRRAIWNAVNPHTGMRRINEAFPLELRESTSDASMLIRMRNGSTWSVIGSDRYDTSIVGTSIAGIVFSEFALANPSAWAYCRPILEENDGWALFITTPRGRNHAYEMFHYARSSPDWFAQLLTVKDTGALNDKQLTEALREYQSIYGHDAGESFYHQEFFCDFAAALLGSFYSYECRQVRDEGRMLEIDVPAGTPVHRSWDIGVAEDNDTSIWFFAVVGGQVYILDHYSASGVGLEHFRDVIFKRERERGWHHGIDYVPHDAKVQEWGSGRTRVETMRALGLKPMLVPLASIADGINAVRRTLPLAVFHPRTEAGGFSALEQYRREWDDDKKCFKPSALHDWASNPADSFRYLSMSWRSAPVIEAPEPKQDGWRIPPPPEPRRGVIQL